MNRSTNDFLTDTLSDALSSSQARVDRVLDEWLPSKNKAPTRLHDAMRYSIFNGGKRVRPALVYLTGIALGIPLEHLDAQAAAVEMIHAYSLIHDDLPAMDDDDLRRGQPTCHRAFDEATAILAGDALQALAFTALVRHSKLGEDRPRTVLDMVDLLADSAGAGGMVAGQVIDMESMGKEISVEELEVMHAHKTGALIRASVLLGAIASPNLSEQDRDALERYAKAIGLAFQVHDDVLDVIGSTEELGKRQGNDEELGKSTYTSLLGLEAAKKLEAELVDQAITAIQHFDSRADLLRAMAQYIIERRN